jgi:thermolysin
MKRFAILMTFGWLAAAAYGFLPEDPVDARAAGGKAAGPAPAARVPNAAQLQAAGCLPEAEVEWDQKTGAPLSVRGKLPGPRNLGGKGPRVAGKGDYAADAIAVLDSLTDIYALKDASKEFVVFRVDADNLGFQHARLRQMHQGLRVVGGELIVHFNKDKQAYQVNGRYLPAIAIPVTPTLKPAEAAIAAKADLKARGKPAGQLKGAPELIVFADNSDPLLAYELLLTYPAGKGTLPGHWVYTVDALSGKIVNAFNAIPSATASISGNRLAGEGGETVTVIGTLTSGSYYLKSALWLIHNNDYTGSFPDSNSDAKRSTANWGASDRVEMSAACNYSAIQAYYSNVHGRVSYNGSGAKATVNVHHYYGIEYNNAYWDSDAQAFYFYDGDGVELTGLTVSDVAGHEFTHAVTEYTANLTYRNESGALNESFSDIFGALIEFKNQPDGRNLYPGKRAGYADWLLAEDCEVSVTAMRDLRNPSSTNTLAAGDQQPSKYRGTYWYTGSQDNGGVHVNSGVQNFFFYLLCEGGSGNNDGTSYSVTGIGIDNAAQVAYRALTVYCTASTDHSGARSAWLSAAADLNSDWVGSVQSGWAAVGVSSNVTPTSRATPLMDDFDGDYYGDPARFDPATGTFYGLLSSLGYAAASLYFGAGEDYVPLTGFWDYDWKADPTIYDSAWGYWYMAFSTDDYNWWYLDWYGDSSSLPVCADFDGDLFADPTFYCQNDGYWYILLSSLGWDYFACIYYSASSGLLPFGGDFDGDWYADPTFYSPNSGNWYCLLSSWDYVYYDTLWFGAAGYTPALGDFDGDFRADPILRSPEGHWYVLLSSSQYVYYFDWTW